MSLLEVRDLTVSYGRLPAVRDLSLDVAEGELVSIVGRNGVGKSTTLLAIAGALTPTAGSVRFDGQSLVGLRLENVIRQGVALVPESRHIFARLTVAENLQLGATTRRDKAAVRSETARLVERLPALGRALDRSAAALSGGEQQQLAIARALLGRPRLLMLDEPSLGLSPVAIDEIFSLIGELHGDGVTVVLVEQNVRRALQVADRAYLLESGGRVVLTGTGAEVLKHTGLADAYLGVEVPL